MPRSEPGFRKQLLEFYLDCYEGDALSDWLRDLGESPKGSIAERQERIRSSTKYVSMPADKFPEQTQNYLQPLSSDDLADLCEELRLEPSGTKELRYQRIMREVRYREGLYIRPESVSPGGWTATLVRPFIEHYPILRWGKLERDYYDSLYSELIEVFGRPNVHQQFPFGFGNSLKIDFHIGSPNTKGVGIEVKMPASNSDVMKAVGQLGQYKDHYGDNLLLLLFPEFINEAARQTFVNAAATQGIQVVERRHPNDVA